MATIPAGQAYVARAEWRAYDDGPYVDVTGLTIKITRLADVVVIVGPTSTGIAHAATGIYLYQWTPASDASGDYLIVWSGTSAAGDAVQASEIVTVGTASPTSISVQDVVDYIGEDSAARWIVAVGDADTYPQIQDALAAETRAQLGRVTYPAATDANPTPDVSDLLDALKRRVQRNLAMRALPLAMQTLGDSGMVARPGGTDPEIRRLEAPFRKRTVG